MSAKIKAAILAAAAHIDANPGTYEFMENAIPTKLNDRGCALGWIGYFLGMKAPDRHFEVAKALGTESMQFYNTMDDVMGRYWQSDDPLDTVLALRRLSKLKFPTRGENDVR